MPKIKACVITCIDYRFQQSIKNYLEKNGLLGEADVISIAGASHGISTPENPESNQYLMDQISTSISLHQPDKIIIIEHQDCGMYAITEKIPHDLNLTEDIEKHARYLIKAKNIIQEKFNDIEIELLIAGLDGSFTKI